MDVSGLIYAQEDAHTSIFKIVVFLQERIICVAHIKHFSGDYPTAWMICCVKSDQLLIYRNFQSQFFLDNIIYNNLLNNSILLNSLI